jgi:hypothetical protein
MKLNKTIKGFEIDMQQNLKSVEMINGIMTKKEKEMYEESVEKMDNNLNVTQENIQIICDRLKEFLLEKNKRYGNSALNPARIFSKADNIEQIKVRLDDKISRIKNSIEDRENDYLDLIGYIVLFMVQKNWNDFEKYLD